MKRRHLYYVLNELHQPVKATLLESVMYIGDDANRVLAYDAVGDDAYVSTIFLGSDHRALGNGRPVLFETMVFGEGDTVMEQIRYVSYDDAMAGHATALKRTKMKNPA